MRLRVHLKHRKRVVVAQLVVQHLVIGASAQKLVEPWNACAFNVHFHIRFGDFDLAHGRIYIVLRTLGVVPAPHKIFFFVHNAANAAKLKHPFEVKAHCHKVAHAAL